MNMCNAELSEKVWEVFDKEIKELMPKA